MLVWAGCLLVIAAIALLRFAWRRPRRSWPLNAAAWALLSAGLVSGGAAHGAWGVAIVALAATGLAFVLLAHAALTTRRGKSRPLERRVHLLDEDAPLRLGGRLLTFAITVPLALSVALALGLAARALAGRAGWHEGNGNVMTMFLMPLAWAVLMFALLMAERRRTQAAMLLVPALASAAVLAGLRP